MPAPSIPDEPDVNILTNFIIAVVSPVSGATRYNWDISNSSGVVQSFLDDDTLVTFTDLEPDTDYTIRVQAENDDGSSGYRSISVSTASLPNEGTWQRAILSDDTPQPALMVSFPDDNIHITTAERNVVINSVTYSAEGRILAATLPASSGEFGRDEFEITLADSNISASDSWHNRFYNNAAGKKIIVGVSFATDMGYSDIYTLFTGVIDHTSTATPAGRPPQVVLNCVNGFAKNDSTSNTRTTDSVQRARNSDDNSLQYADRPFHFLWGQ